MSKINFKTEKIPFTQVANVVLNDKLLSAKAKGLYAYLYSKPDGWDFAIDRIANDFSDGRKSINAGLQELEQNGYLLREKQSSGKVVYVLKSQMTKMDIRLLEPDVQNGKEPKRQIAEMGTISNKEGEVIKNSSNTTPIVPTGDEMDFELFWSSYPRKVGKEAARRSWAKTKGKRPTINVLLKAVEDQKKTEQWNKDRGAFIPHPATWLNQGRWDDEVETQTVSQETWVA